MCAYVCVTKALRGGILRHYCRVLLMNSCPVEYGPFSNEIVDALIFPFSDFQFIGKSI